MSKGDADEERRKQAEERLYQASKLDLTPPEIADRLGVHCIGQEAVVDAIAVTVYQHLRRCGRAASGMPILQHVHIPPVLLIGPSGCGKTTLARAIGQITGLPVHVADCTQITEEGYVGLSASDMIRCLLLLAGGSIELCEHGILVLDEWDKLRQTDTTPSGRAVRDVSGAGAQQAMLNIIDGGQVIVPVQDATTPGRQRLVGVTTAHMLIIACGAFEGIEPIIARRLGHRRRIGFGSTGGADARVGPGDLLSRVTPDDVVEYGMCRQVAARLERILVMSPLSEGALRDILCLAPDGPIQTQQRLAMEVGFRFEFSSNLIDLMVREAQGSGLGARALWGLVGAATQRAWFEVPDKRRDSQRYPWGRTVVQLRVDSLTDGYYGLRVTDRMVWADVEEFKAGSTGVAMADGG